MYRSSLSVLAFLGSIFALQPAARTQAAWADLGLSGPAPRERIAMAWDRARDRVVTFGGLVGGTLQDDQTWIYDGATWSQRNLAIRPGARDGAVLVWDDNSGGLLMFGGYDGAVTLADSWRFDGVGWSAAPTVNTPQSRTFHAMAWDGNSNAVLMFGGATTVPSFQILADNWRRVGNTWSAAAGGPPLRCSHGMVWDERLQRVVMFGGWTGASELGDTWEWDGAAWTQRFPAVRPSARQEFIMEFDAARGRTVLSGGRAATTRFDDTWEWDGITWRRIALSPTPARRSLAGAAYHGGSARVVMFGGNIGGTSVLGDTWRLATPRPASSDNLGVGCNASSGLVSMAVEPWHEAWAGDEYAVQIENVPIGRPAVVAFGFSTTTWGGLTLPFPLDGLGAPGCTVWYEAALPFAAVNQGTRARWAFDVLDQPSTYGVRFVLQGFVLDPAANALGIVTTDGVASTIGVR